MKWISLDEKKPRCCDSILFSDGSNVYAGWLETYEPLEEISFHAILEVTSMRHSRDMSPEGITHWAPIPKPPKLPESS